MMDIVCVCVSVCFVSQCVYTLATDTRNSTLLAIRVVNNLCLYKKMAGKTVEGMIGKEK